MLALHGKEPQRRLIVGAPRAIGSQAARGRGLAHGGEIVVGLGVHHIEVHADGQVIGDLASGRAGLATIAAIQVDGHSVTCHG